MQMTASERLLANAAWERAERAKTEYRAASERIRARLTEGAYSPLQLEGWTAEHNIELGRYVMALEEYRAAMRELVG